MHRAIFTAAVLAIAGLSFASDARAEEPLHLFILSGQSNMAGLDPSRSFTPAVNEAFGADHVIVVKEAWGGQPIRRWYKKWELGEGDDPKQIGDLYDKLMASVKKAVGDRKPTTVTFAWMQGERDAKEKHGDVYADAMLGLVKQLREDLGRDDMSFVIGRLSPFGSETGSHPDWETVRAAQVKAAESDPLGAWIDTDQVPRKHKDIHYKRPEGFDDLGKRFAAACIELVRKASK